MNNDELVHRHVDGLLSDEEVAQLSRLLETDAAARQRYLEIAGLHAALAADETLRAPEPVLRPAQEARPVRTRSFAQLAAGVVFGALAVGTAWAMAQPRAPRVVPLAVSDAGFENGTVPARGGVPDERGRWQGDVCEVVAEVGVAKPRTGGGMLRFVSVNTVSNAADSGPICSDIWQIVPLPPGGARVVKVRAHFNSDTGAKPSRFHLYAMAGAGDAVSVPALWAGRFGESSNVLASGRVMKFTDSDPATWEPAEVTLNVPPEARVLLVAIAAYRLPHTKPADFLPAQFLDDVSVTIQEAEVQP